MRRPVDSFWSEFDDFCNMLHRSDVVVVINDGVPTWHCSHFSHDVKCGNALSFVPSVLSQIWEMDVLWVNVCREGVVGGSEELVM